MKKIIYQRKILRSILAGRIIVMLMMSLSSVSPSIVLKFNKISLVTAIICQRDPSPSLILLAAKQSSRTCGE